MYLNDRSSFSIVNMHTMKILTILMSFFTGGYAPPPYFASVANKVLQLKGKAQFSDVNVAAIMALEQQVKRIMGSDPSMDLNVTELRDKSDSELLGVLLLAVLGNFTTAAGSSWHQPCSLVVDPLTGGVVAVTPPVVSTLALKVVVILLIVVQFRQWIREEHGKKPEPRKGA